MSNPILTFVPPFLNKDVDDEDDLAFVAGGNSFLKNLRSDVANISKIKEETSYRRQTNANLNDTQGKHPLAVLAARVYLALRSTGSSQSVFMRNAISPEADIESEANTTLHFEHMLRFLKFFETVSSSKTRRIHRRITAAHNLVAALGCKPLHSAPRNAKPPLIPGIGICTELIIDNQFSQGVIGAKISLLYLEKLESNKKFAANKTGISLNSSASTSALSAIPQFAVFSALLTGASPELILELKLSQFAAAGLSARSAPSVSLDGFLADLQLLGLAPSAHLTVMSYLSAILHLRAIEFQSDRHETGVKNPASHLEPASKLLGIEPHVLTEALITKNRNISQNGGRNPISILLSPTEARCAAHNYAAALYTQLVNWLIDFANARLCVEPDSPLNSGGFQASYDDAASIYDGLSSIGGGGASAGVLGGVAASTISSSNTNNQNQLSLYIFYAVAQVPSAVKRSMLTPLVVPQISIDIGDVASPTKDTSKSEYYAQLSSAVCGVLDNYFSASINEFFSDAEADGAQFLRPMSRDTVNFRLAPPHSLDDDREFLSVERECILPQTLIDALSRSEDNALAGALFSTYLPAAASHDHSLSNHLVHLHSILAQMKKSYILPYLAISQPPSILSKAKHEQQDVGIYSMPAAAEQLAALASSTQGMLDCNVLLPKVARRYASVAQMHRIDLKLPAREIFTHLIGSLAMAGSTINTGRKSLWLTFASARILESELRLARKDKPMQRSTVIAGSTVNGSASSNRYTMDASQMQSMSNMSAYAASEISDEDAATEFMSVVDGPMAFRAHGNSGYPGSDYGNGSSGINSGRRTITSMATNGYTSKGAPFPYFQSAKSNRMSMASQVSSARRPAPSDVSAGKERSSQSEASSGDSAAGNAVNPALAKILAEGKAPSPNAYRDLDAGEDPEMKTTDARVARRRWLLFVKTFTFYIPSFLLSVSGIKTDPVQIAWREKFTIFTLIIISCLLVLFIIAGLGPTICPPQKVWSLGELTDFAANKKKYYTAIYGNIYSLDEILTLSIDPLHNMAMFQPLAGQDITSGFTRSPGTYCKSVKDNSIELTYSDPEQAPYVSIKASHRSSSQGNGGNKISNFLVTSPTKKAKIVTEVTKILDLWNPPEGVLQKNNIIYKKTVYDLTPYFDTLRINQNAEKYRFLAKAPENVDEKQNLDDYIRTKASQGTVDFTEDATFTKLFDPDMKKCFDAIFPAGLVDERNSVKCLVTNYLLFGMSALLASIIFIKFLTALQTSAKKVTPSDMDKFVMMQVPCYTEDEESLRKTINSLVSTDYDDRRKLLVLICDGMVVGHGNDRPTPRIVLDILGCDPDGKLDPPALPYQAIGNGVRQYNMAKLYSGLYSHKGHVVPYLVVAKCGAPDETVKPGNRGKRDSQMVLMRFLNHLHYNYPMSPLELEMQHHIQNIIGIDPRWYEYMLMIDADTMVFRDSVQRLVAYSTTDRDIVGVCGETKIINEKATFTTMIQVYEYFISHHISKAFESFFGAITCLPGCFSMYRIYSASRNKPFLCDDNVVEQYADVKVDTLHKKNLLSLGEDRYLTTLILRTFPTMKTKFTPLAQAHTQAPEQFSVLLSQRRRWINSTLHNLFELVLHDKLCGFCCFSMRFIVLIDLVSTILMPATVLYLFYLLYLTIKALVTGEGMSLVVVSLVLLAIIYGLQAIVFIFKREFSNIVWMLIYLLAIPIFGLYLPLYSFWNMDDFRWGTTRVIFGEKGEKRIVEIEKREEEFNPASIPHVKWSDYQQQVEDAEVYEMPLSASEIQAQQSHKLPLFAQQGAGSGLMAQPINAAAPLGGGAGPSYIGGGSGRPFSTYANDSFRPQTIMSGVFPQGQNPLQTMALTSMTPATASYAAGALGSGSGGGSGRREFPGRPGSVISVNSSISTKNRPTFAAANSAGGAVIGGNTGSRNGSSNGSMYDGGMMMGGGVFVGNQGIAGGGGGGGGGVVVNSPARRSLWETAGTTTTPGGGGGGSADDMPTASQLEDEVRRILASSDLRTTTKRQIRNELAAMFGVDLEGQRAAINAMIDQALPEIDAETVQNDGSA